MTIRAKRFLADPLNLASQIFLCGRWREIFIELITGAAISYPLQVCRWFKFAF